MHLINFTCPHCKQKTNVWEMEYCPVSNSIDSFKMVGWEQDGDEKFIKATEVETTWGLPQIHEPDIPKPHWICSGCLEEIDPTIRSEVDLFNWLNEHGMLEEL